MKQHWITISYAKTFLGGNGPVPKLQTKPNT